MSHGPYDEWPDGIWKDDETKEQREIRLKKDASECIGPYNDRGDCRRTSFHEF